MMPGSLRALRIAIMQYSVTASLSEWQHKVPSGYIAILAKKGNGQRGGLSINPPVLPEQELDVRRQTQPFPFRLLLGDFSLFLTPGTSTRLWFTPVPLGTTAPSPGDSRSGCSRLPSQRPLSAAAARRQGRAAVVAAYCEAGSAPGKPDAPTPRRARDNLERI